MRSLCCPSQIHGGGDWKHLFAAVIQPWSLPSTDPRAGSHAGVAGHQGDVVQKVDGTRRRLVDLIPSCTTFPWLLVLIFSTRSAWLLQQDGGSQTPRAKVQVPGERLSWRSIRLSRSLCTWDQSTAENSKQRWESLAAKCFESCRISHLNLVWYKGVMSHSGPNFSKIVSFIQVNGVWFYRLIVRSMGPRDRAEGVGSAFDV